MANIYPDIFKRKFTDNGMEEKNSDFIRISEMRPDYLKKIVRGLFREGKINDNSYILGVIYTDGKGIDTDYQIGITGTCKETEHYLMAMNRELGEELGLSSNKLTMKKYKNNRGYYVNIRDCEYIAQSANGARINAQLRDEYDKVGCIVYGDRDAISNCINRANIYRYHSDDNITGIVGIKVSVVRRAFLIFGR